MNNVFTVGHKAVEFKSGLKGYPVFWSQPEDRDAFAGYPLALLRPCYITGAKWKLAFADTVIGKFGAGVLLNSRTKKDLVSFMRHNIAPLWPQYRLVAACRLYKNTKEPSDELVSLVTMARFEGLTHKDTTKTIRERNK
jgi:hypothetical protein